MMTVMVYAHPKRVVAVICFIVMYMLISAMIRYLCTFFMSCCVVYTVSDLYKKRKRFIWIIKLVVRGGAFFVTNLIGEEAYHKLFEKKRKRLKK